MAPKPISVIGSTVSIGHSTLAVVDRYPERLRVEGIATYRNWEKLAEQANRYRPRIVGIVDSTAERQLRDALPDGTQLVTGESALTEVASAPQAETSVVAVVGFPGVEPTLAAIDAGHDVALANKETLITAGEIVMARAKSRGVTISPIDSEHSAIWQCLRAGESREVRRIILTASGGPFRERPLDQFASITPDEALAHPTWSMGPRITIDSATMMNKGFEVIEAARLFELRPDQIDVVIHPQSIVHSMVEFQDGSVIAQLGATDMTLPIAYALFAPERPPAAEGTPLLDVQTMGRLEFEKPQPERFPALGLALRVLDSGGTAPTVLNAADEVAVAAFLDHRISFLEITATVEATLNEHSVVKQPSLQDIIDADHWARQNVNQRISATYTQSGVSETR